VNQYRQGVGFAIGTGLVPGVMTFLVIGITSGRFLGAFIAGILMWTIVSATFWYRARRPPKPRR